MDSIIYQNNYATENIFSFHILPYFYYENLLEFSTINQSTDNYSLETNIDNVLEILKSTIFFEKHKIFGMNTENLKFAKNKRQILKHLHFTSKSKNLKLYTPLEELYLRNKCDQTVELLCPNSLRKIKLILRYDCIFLNKNFENLEEFIGEYCEINKLKFLINAKNIKKLTLCDCESDPTTDGWFANYSRLEYINISDNINLKNFFQCEKLKYLEYTPDGKETLNFPFPSLETLIICNVNFTGISLEKLKNLRYLNICGCSGIHKENFKILENLENLEIKFGESFDDKIFSEIKKLKHLKIYRITVSHNKGIRNLPILESLHLNYMRIMNNYFEQCINLKELVIEANDKIGYVDGKAMKTLVSLEKLKLANFSGCVNEFLGELINLRELEIFHYIEANDDINDCFENLINLEVISFVRGNVSDIIFVSLKKLRKLSMIGCQYMTGSEIKQLPNLEYLYLRNCNEIENRFMKRIRVKHLEILSCKKLAEVSEQVNYYFN